MAERRQPCEITQRHQIYARIKELKSRCEYLTKVEHGHSSRLSELNTIVDQLNAEKRLNKYDPNLKINLSPPYTTHIISESSKSYKHHHREQPPTSTNTATTSTTDLNTLHYDPSSSSRRDGANNALRQKSSDAFKIKLSNCLQEVKQKAEEIVELSEHLYGSDFKK